MLYSDDRRLLGRYLLLGALFSILVMVLGYWLHLVPLPAFRDAAERVLFALRLQILVLPWLAAAVAVATYRGNAAADAARVQDMLEQTVLAFGAHLVLAVALRGEEMVMVAMLAALFCVGRAAWWFGDSVRPGLRAFGFALSFFPSLAAYVLAALLLLLRG